MPERLALLPASVLIGDPDQQWLSTAVPLVLQQDLATSPSLSAIFVPNASTAYQLQAAEVLRATVEQRKGRFRVQATLTAGDTQHTRKVIDQEGPVNEGITPLLDALAKKIDPSRASNFSSRRDSAFKLFVAAVNSTDTATRSRLLTAAVESDSNFGLAHIARVENDPQAPPPAPVSDAAFTPLDRARWLALLGRIHHAPLVQQANAQAVVLGLAPNNVEALTALGVDRFLLANNAEGERLLRRAILLDPSNPTLPLQLAQGLVAASRFREAAGILSPLASSNANLLLPLSLVELLDGNASGAVQTWKRFLSFLPAGSPAIPALELQWQRFVKPDALAPPVESPDFWRNALQQSGDTNLAARAMYAAALDHAGQAEQARRVRVLPFIPEFTDPNGPIAFYEMRRLTGRLDRK